MNVRLSVGVAVATFAVLAAACGADDSSDTAGDSPTSVDESSGPAEAEVIRVAVAGPLAGDFAFYGAPIEDGARFAAEQINAAGGIESGPYEGATVEIVPFDDQLDPAQDADIAQQVLDDEGIWALTGFASSDGALAAREVLERAGQPLPLVASYASSPSITDGAEDTFILASPHGAYGLAAVAEAEDAGAESVAVLQINGEFGESIGGIVQDGLDAAGIEVAVVQSFDSGTTDVGAQVLSARDSGADTLVTVGYGSDVVATLTATEAIGWEPRLIDAGGGAFDPTVLEGAAEAAEGLVGVVDYDPGSTNDANQALVEAFGSPDVPPPFAHGYESVVLIAEALESGPADRSELGAAIAEVTLDDTGVGALRFDEDGNPLDRPMFVFTIEDGEFMLSHGYVFDGEAVSRIELER